MKILIFGATGMVGQGVLRECLIDRDIEQIVTVGRERTGKNDPKLHELVLPDLFAIGALEAELSGFDACFFCLGVSSVGLSETEYSRITFDLAIAIAELLARLNPGMTFVYVSGAGADGSGQSRLMWARVKGRTENRLRELPFKAVFLLRPGFIQPLHGIVSKTGWYRAVYAITAPISGLVGRLSPALMTTTERLGRAMIGVARKGYPQPVLENSDINRAALR
jgi:uncharacterized protein YbjT (DUF2867 family)